MNQEVANFYVEFTTKGLAELKQGLADINDSVQELGDELDSGKSRGHSFFDGITGWITKIGALTASFFSLRAAIRGIFSVNTKVLDIYNLSDIIGIDPTKLEGLGIATEVFKGGGLQAASDFMGTLNDALEEMRWARYKTSWEEGMAMYGVDWRYDKNKSIEENREYLMSTLSNAFQRLDPLSGSRLASIFNINDAMYQLLKNPQWREMWQAGMDKAVLTTDPKNLENAVRLEESKRDLQRSWDNLMLQLTPVLTRLIDDFAKPLVDNFAEFAKNHDLAGILNRWLDGLIDFASKVWPDVKRVLLGLVDVLGALFSWVFGKGEYTDVKVALNKMLGIDKMESDVVAENKAKNAGIIGGAIAGGALGAGFGGVGAVPGAILGALAGYFGVSAGIDDAHAGTSNLMSRVTDTMNTPISSFNDTSAYGGNQVNMYVDGQKAASVEMTPAEIIVKELGANARIGSVK